MAAARLTMRQVKELLRLKWEQNLSDRAIARRLRISRPAVADSVRRALAAGLSWPLAKESDEAALERQLFPLSPPVATVRPLPDCATIRQELTRRDVTLMLLWTEFKTQHPDGFQYTQFCAHYHRYAKMLCIMPPCYH